MARIAAPCAQSRPSAAPNVVNAHVKTMGSVPDFSANAARPTAPSSSARRTTRSTIFFGAPAAVRRAANPRACIRVSSSSSASTLASSLATPGVKAAIASPTDRPATDPRSRSAMAARSSTATCSNNNNRAPSPMSAASIIAHRPRASKSASAITNAAAMSPSDAPSSSASS